MLIIQEMSGKAGHSSNFLPRESLSSSCRQFI